MRKNSYIFTAILAIVVSTGAWASTPTEKEAQDGTSHTVFDNAPIEGEATEGIAGVRYVNRVANRAGVAAQAAENHAAHASKSAYDAATAASNAQASANIAAAVIENLQSGDGVTVTDVKNGNSTVGKKVSAQISDGLKIVDSGNDKGAIAVNPGVGIKINNDAVAVNTGAGLKAANDGAVTINEGVGLKLEGNVLVPNLAAGDSVTITQGTGDDVDKLVISVHPSDTILDAATNQVLNNVKEGTAITVTPNVSGGEVTDITISANTPTDTTPGVVQMPTYTEMQRIINPDATPQAAPLGEGALDRKYGLSVETYMNAEAQQQLELSAALAQQQLELNEKVSLPTDTNDKPIKNVGANARPVYVNNGTAAAVESITIPVDADNFENATTTAKIWIQK